MASASSNITTVEANDNGSSSMSSRQFKISCICGHPLTKYDDAYSIYNHSRISCDVCDKRIPKSQSAWHCG